jgi:P-type Cu+ transporter
MTAMQPVSHAPGHHHHPADAPGTVQDPVCGMSVDPAVVRHRTDYAGDRYFFCSANCREKFTDEPARYIPSPRVGAPGTDARTKACAVLWTCPMHPQIVRKEPGNCPICGMALEPMTPTAGDTVSPELRDMTRRFWVGVALSVPLLAMAMAEHFDNPALRGCYGVS